MNGKAGKVSCLATLNLDGRIIEDGGNLIEK